MAESNVSNIEETNNQILNDIQNLQSMEQEMFSNLEENPNLTQAQQQAIIQNINQISSMRLNLYQTLTGVTGYFQNSLTNSQGTLKEQATAIDIVEDELNRAKEKLRLLEEQKNNQVRLIEINTYYGEKYQEHAALMKIIIATLIPIIILAILHNKGIIPDVVYYGLIIIIAAIGSYFMWYRVASIWNRDNMNYQEYNWPDYTPPKKSSSTSSTADDPWANGVTGSLGSFSLGCVDQYCCASGTTFDASINQCIIPGSSTSSSTGGGGSYSSSTGGGGSYSSSTGGGGSYSSSTSGTSNTPATGSTYSGAGSVVNNLCNNFTPSPSTPALNQLCAGAGNGTTSGSLGTTVESYVNLNEIYTKHARNTRKADVTLGGGYQPKEADSFINYN
jgi:hypothetical protein